MDTRRTVALFRDLAIARADGNLRSVLARLSRINVLVIDDWAMAPLAEIADSLDDPYGPCLDITRSSKRYRRYR